MSQPEGGSKKRMLVWTSVVLVGSQLRKQHGEGPFETAEDSDGAHRVFINQHGKTVKIAAQYLEFQT